MFNKTYTAQGGNHFSKSLKKQNFYQYFGKKNELQALKYGSEIKILNFLFKSLVRKKIGFIFPSFGSEHPSAQVHNALSSEVYAFTKKTSICVCSSAFLGATFVDMHAKQMIYRLMYLM